MDGVSPEQEALVERLEELRAEHEALNREVDAIAENGVVDQLKYARLKKEKLRLKDRIIELRDWSEEHYKKLAEGYLQSVFKVMHELKIPSNLMSLSAHLDLKKLKTLVRENEKDLKKPHELMEMLDAQDQASKSIESLVAEIRNFTSSEIGHLFTAQEGQETLTLEEVIKQRGIAYFCLPALEFPSMSQTLGRLIINDLKATVAQNLSQSDRPPLYAIFDEFWVESHKGT